MSVKLKSFDLMILGAIFITLIITPLINSDSMIIPKVIILASVATFILPKTLFNFWKYKRINKLATITFTIVTLIFIQLNSVAIASQAPFVQQFFGRTGRGLGLVTHFSLLIFFVAAVLYAQTQKIKVLINSIALAGFISSIYCIVQFFGLDFFNWVDRTNGIIGTLGNPNFQSSLAAMALVPALVLSWSSRYRYFLLFFCLGFFVFVLYICNSTQGYITSTTSLIVYLILLFWNKKKSVSLLILFPSVVLGSIAIFGMLNNGPFASILYKVSVISRGEFWRSAFSMANSNPIFGVGIDSFADSYFKFRSSKDADGIREFADNAHNIFLEYAATGGYPLAVFHIILIILSLYSYYKIVQNDKKFDKYLTALFCAWLTFQMQSIISPQNISALVWNSLISGLFIGLAIKITSDQNYKDIEKSNLSHLNSFGYFFLFLTVLTLYPYFNVDKLQLEASQKLDGNLAVRVAQMYPESTLRYTRIGTELLQSNLLDQALTVGRSAIQFNPNSVSAWAMILANTSAPVDERKQASREIMKLDPYNKIVKLVKLD